MSMATAFAILAFSWLIGYVTGRADSFNKRIRRVLRKRYGRV